MSSLKCLRLHTLDCQWLDAVIALDQKSLGGLWTRLGYQQEIERDNGICCGISSSDFDLLAMGFAWIILDEVHLISVAVDPQYQRRGFGTLVLIQLLLRAIAKSCDRSTLEVNASNQGAIRLYEHLNFKALGTRPDYYGKGEDAVIYWLNHLQHQSSQLFLEQLWADAQNRLMKRNMKLLLELEEDLGATT